jgi:hypothetical protein
MAADPKRNPRFEKLSIAFSGIALLICDATIAAFAVRHWHVVSGLSHFWLVYVAVSFALLWFVQVLERGRIVCLAWTCIAALGAVQAVITAWTPH